MERGRVDGKTVARNSTVIRKFPWKPGTRARDDFGRGGEEHLPAIGSGLIQLLRICATMIEQSALRAS